MLQWLRVKGLISYVKSVLQRLCKLVKRKHEKKSNISYLKHKHNIITVTPPVIKENWITVI